MSKIKELGFAEIATTVLNAVIVVSLVLIFSPFGEWKTALYTILFWGLMQGITIVLSETTTIRIVILSIFSAILVLTDLGLGQFEIFSYALSVIALSALALVLKVK